MLSRKQKWRRTLRRQRPVEFQKIFTGFCPREKIHSDSHIICEDECEEKDNKVYKMDGVIKDKKIRFNRIVKVFPIIRTPTNIQSTLWWTDDDYNLFKLNYAEDLKKSEKYDSM